MITVSQARELITQRIGPLASERIPLPQAHGRVLREPVASAEDLPAFDRSAVDGYAVRVDEAAEELEVIGEIRAGDAVDRQLQPGQTLRIFTGARLPGRDLKVVMQEQVEKSGGKIRLRGRSDASNVRLRGEDARAGEILLETGTVLEAAAVALLASVGKAAFLVSKRPRILHLTTGDEIVPPGQIPGPGQIRNSNAALIAALCREQGVEGVSHLHAGDDLQAMIDLVTQARSKTYDMILVSGGSGPGSYDFSGELFRHLGAEIHFREISVRPGKPLIFGTSDAQVIFGLPGNALSHFVCFQLFVRRALERMLARSASTTTRGFLSDAMTDTLNARETWWPARTWLREGRLEVRALSWKSSGDITRLPGADALIRVAASTSQLSAGTMVEVLST